jgi:hypothetical protein
MANTYPSRALAEAHENASDLYRCGVLTVAASLRSKS